MEAPVATARLNVQGGTAWAAMAMAFALTASLADTARALDRSATGAAQNNQARRQQVSQRTAALHNEMVSYRALQAGWDGVGSVAPSRGVIDSALAFLALLPDTVSLPETSVAADGEVGFFWKSQGVYIDVGFPAPGRISYYASAHGLIARDAGPFDGSTISQELLTVISRV